MSTPTSPPAERISAPPLPIGLLESNELGYFTDTRSIVVDAPGPDAVPFSAEWFRWLDEHPVCFLQ